MFDTVRRALTSTCLVNIIWRHRQLDYKQKNPVWGESDAFVAAALASSDVIVP